MTFIRGFGNIGDQLIHAGTRRLLARLPYREATTRDVTELHGHTAILTGGGGWCVPFHRQLPAALPIVEQHFTRVIIFPSTFDTAEPTVREALARTNALVFARERSSYAQLQGLCRSALAYDCAFFFDIRPYHLPGRGVLHAFRTDAEALGAVELPADNDDISVTCDNLDEWLWRIARHARVETDRAHVMIAAALMGKPVTYRATSYHKVPAIAAYALRDFPVHHTS